MIKWKQHTKQQNNWHASNNPAWLTALNSNLSSQWCCSYMLFAMHSLWPWKHSSANWEQEKFFHRTVYFHTSLTNLRIGFSFCWICHLNPHETLPFLQSLLQPSNAIFSLQLKEKQPTGLYYCKCRTFVFTKGAKLLMSSLSSINMITLMVMQHWEEPVVIIINTLVIT